MGIKQLLIIYLILLLSVQNTNSIQNDNYQLNENKNYFNQEQIIINIAIYTLHNYEISNPFQQYYYNALNNYIWKIGNTEYKFKVKSLSLQDLIRGKLNVLNYDVIIYLPEIYNEFHESNSRFLKVHLIEKIFIRNFIENGGNYYGSGMGGILANIKIHRPDCYKERIINKVSLDISNINMDSFNTISPLKLVSGFNGNIDPYRSYYLFHGLNTTSEYSRYKGACLDVQISKDNPIFNNYPYETLKIRWMGNPPFAIPDDSASKITTLAYFPTKELHENISTRLHSWEYNDNIDGIINGIKHFNALTFKEKILRSNKYLIYAIDWEQRQDNIVETNFKDKAFLTSEIYPNENKARIIRSAGLLEWNVWFDGSIEEIWDNEVNSLYEGFYKWSNITDPSDTVADENSYNYWLLRRIIGWSSKKIPNNHLPPMNSPSEVSKPESYEVPSNLILNANTEMTNGKVTIDLYYRFSNDNISWTDWIYYGSDGNGSDGWSWSFDSENAFGFGYYEFYSLRSVEYEEYSELELPPSHPDINIHVTERGFKGWHQLGLDGIGNSNNIAIRGMEVFDDKLIIGTANYHTDEGALQFDIVFNFTDFFRESLINNTFDYKNFQSDGCELWAYDGKNLIPIVANEIESNIESGFGNSKNIEIGFIIEFKNYIYVGLRNEVQGCQVWRSSDLISWNQVVNNGFGNINNTWAMTAKVFDDFIFIGTHNSKNGCEVFKSNNGVDWECIVGEGASIESGFGSFENFYAWSMCVYDSSLFIGTTRLDGGGELWRTSDGITMQPVIAYETWLEARLNGAICPRGIARGDFLFRGGIRNMIVYDDELYLGFTGEDTFFGLEIPNINFNFDFRQGFLSLRLKRFLSLGCEIWRYNASTNSLKKEVGGIKGGYSSGGFGDSINEYPWSMELYDGELYISTIHPEPFTFRLSRQGLFHWTVVIPTPKGSGEIWKYDGNSWQPVVGDQAASYKFDIINGGFKDPYNIGFRMMKSYNDKLYIGSMNTKTGAELWEYRP